MTTTSTAISRTFAELGNSIRDAYAHVVHGDEAGVHQTFVFIAKPRPISIHDNYTEKYDLGMTFIEINDRAFVSSVVPNSDADRAGVRPQDCVQLATTPPSRSEGFQDCDDECIKFALDCETKGMRSSFDELRQIFEHSAVHGVNEILFSSTKDADVTKRKRTLKQTLRSTTQTVVGSVGMCSSLSLNNVCHSVFYSNDATPEIQPVFLVLRHTESRQRLVGNPHIGLPSFRLDDECKRAACIIRRLAPTTDTTHEENAWNEIAQNASKYILNKKSEDFADVKTEVTPEEIDTVEASTIRRMIKNAVGLAFVRASKVVLGLSFHFGSGIVISRLEDGSWSAPSAIGIYGAGLGFQFGLEVADYIFVIQTNEALEHFRRGTNYTVGGNFGAAVGGVGREAFGAASLTTKGKEQVNGGNDNEFKVAPIAAYAKSQGLYFGVSLEGSKIFVREDINHRTYQFSTGRECTTDEILSGIVPPPREAEDLYSTLHNVEFAHEIAQLPKTPDVLQSDQHVNWQYDIDNFFNKNKAGEFIPLHFLSKLSDLELKEINQFESNFKGFMYDGISVQRVIPSIAGRGNDTVERRMLWLTLPDVGALRLGFLSKSNDGSGLNDNDSHHLPMTRSSISGEDNSVASSTTRSNYVEGNLSKKFSINLTDITSIERCSKSNNVTSENVDGTRFIKVSSADGKTLLFITNNVVEAVVLFCGLKLLVEKETSRLGVRGGKSIDQVEVPASRTESTAESSSSETSEELKQVESNSVITEVVEESKIIESNEDGIEKWNGVDMYRNIEGMNMIKESSFERGANNLDDHKQNSFNVSVRQSQSSVSSFDNSGEHGESQELRASYVQGQVLHKEIASNVPVSLPLPLCRALFLDSSSPLISKWETDRGDAKYVYGSWKFKSSSPRSTCQPEISESELLTGGMTGGYRQTAFLRMRKGQIVSMSETLVVEVDESDKLIFSIIERLPRRGFSIAVRVIIRPSSKKSCDVSIVGEFVPLGKNTTDQLVVHRAFLLLMKEMEGRYGLESRGLVAGLLEISLGNSHDTTTLADEQLGQFGSTSLDMTMSNDDDWVEFGAPEQDINSSFGGTSKDIVSKSNKSVQGDSWGLSRVKETSSTQFGKTQSVGNVVKREKPSFGSKERGVPMTPRTQKQKQENTEETIRPPTPSMKQRISHEIDKPLTSTISPPDESFSDYTNEMSTTGPIKIDVKPLPKIRLDLMPSPREVDEEDFEDEEDYF